MKKTKSLYHTQVTIDILSEEPISDIDMNTLTYQLTYGDWSGKINQSKTNQVDGEEAVKMCLEHGTEPLSLHFQPEFFQMDKSGFEIE